MNNLMYAAQGLVNEITNESAHVISFTSPKEQNKKMNLLMNFEKKELGEKKEHPAFKVGDTLKIHYKTKEGGRERTQVLEGLVIERKNMGIRETFTIRRIAHGIGVERTFPLFSPKVEKLEVLKKGSVGRAKLFYLRDKVGKKAKVKEKKG